MSWPVVCRLRLAPPYPPRASRWPAAPSPSSPYAVPEGPPPLAAALSRLVLSRPAFCSGGSVPRCCIDPVCPWRPLPWSAAARPLARGGVACRRCVGRRRPPRWPSPRSVGSRARAARGSGGLSPPAGRRAVPHCARTLAAGPGRASARPEPRSGWDGRGRVRSRWPTGRGVLGPVPRLSVPARPASRGCPRRRGGRRPAPAAPRPPRVCVWGALPLRPGSWVLGRSATAGAGRGGRGGIRLCADRPLPPPACPALRSAPGGPALAAPVTLGPPKDAGENGPPLPGGVGCFSAHRALLTWLILPVAYACLKD